MEPHRRDGLHGDRLVVGQQGGERLGLDRGLVASATYTLTCTRSGGGASATVAPAAAKGLPIGGDPPLLLSIGRWPLEPADTSAPGVGIMVANVANVANGPGTAVNSDYAAAIAAAQPPVSELSATSNALRAISTGTVEASISAWRTLHGVTSIFLDEASTSSSELSYYQTLSSYVHAAGGQTIVNFGTVPAQSEMSAGDRLGRSGAAALLGRRAAAIDQRPQGRDEPHRAPPAHPAGGRPDRGRHRNRLHLAPGITGPWQVLGPPAHLSQRWSRPTISAR